MRTHYLVGMGILVLSLGSSPAGADESLGYRWTSDQEVAYEVTITAELPSAIETLKGTIFFSVVSSEEPAKLRYNGGLTKTSKSKSENGRRPGFGRRPFPFPPTSPFARSTNPFQGLQSTTNQLVVSSRGTVLALEGTSQLPYLLGNLSLLVFEPLPETDREVWTEESGVAITEKSNRSNDPFGGRFGPRFDPFQRFGGEKPEKTSAAGERTSFIRKAIEGDLVTYQRAYYLHSPGDEETITIDGSGTWIFNRGLGLSESLDFQQNLVREENNTKITIPVSIKYHRLTDEQWTKIKEERAEAARKAKEAHERRMAELAEAKRRSEAPLEPEQKRQLLSSLASDDSSAIVRGLEELAKKSPKDPDTEVAAGIESLLRHPNQTVRDKASDALVKWSPQYKRKQELNKAYRGPGFIKAPDRPVAAHSPLFVGQIVAAKDTGAWYAAKIEELLSDGSARVSFPGWGSRKSTVARVNLQLAPDEVDQPNLSPAELAVLRGERLPRVRTWTDRSGRFRIEAEWLRLADDAVLLKRTKDGREVSVPLNKLSQADQDAARELARQSDQTAENPFEPSNPFEP